MPPMLIVGTRPEIIKMAPIMREFSARGREFTLVHTDQHYDQTLSGSFFEQLELPRPDHHLNVRSGTQAEQTARVLLALEPIMSELRPEVVLVEGDTNTVLGGGITAAKLGIPVGHVEAGLRSRDLRMSEEHNRRVVDHLSTHLFAPTQASAANLKREDVWGTTYVTGNTIIDALDIYLDRALSESRVNERIPFDRFVLVTVHRAENVDDPATLRKMVHILREVVPLPVVFPTHPRTVSRLISMGLYEDLKTDPRILLTEPLPYFDFLAAMQRCEYILTDSGGVQEEATHPRIRKPVIVTRLSTERPEAVDAGFSTVVGLDLRRIRDAIKGIDPEGLPHRSPFGDGTAASRIADVIQARCSQAS